MNRRTLLLSLLLSIGLSTLQAQTPLHKLDARARRYLSGAPCEPLASLIVRSGEARHTVQTILAWGHRATAIDDHLLTARVPAAYIEQIAALPEVDYVQAARRLQPTLAEARQQNDADRVHQGDGLDTPFTGRGVVIGLIDEGFEYRHVAFLDDAGQSRVLALWDRQGYADGTDSEPTTDIPATGDGFTASGGHATHVAGIAAGSRISENDWYGMAPEADLVMIPSEFSDAEILEDVKYVCDLAEAQHKPWVINMSFGTMMGAHDSQSYVEQALDSMLTAAPGRMIVGGVGNDAETPRHAMHTFTEPGTATLAVTPSSYGVECDLWDQTADGLHHIDVRPCVLARGERHYLDDDAVRQVMQHAIEPFNRKEHYQVLAAASAIRSYGSDAVLCLEITALQPTTVHAWTGTGYGQVASMGEGFIDGDTAYTIFEPGGTLPHGISVAAYNTTIDYVNQQGMAQHSGYGEVGGISAYSNCGPALHDMPKPTVAAPGTVITSAMSKYGSSFSSTGATIMGSVRRGLRTYYYAALSGTSMATPMVTGSIALWLQANPNLTNAQIHDIVRQTARHDEFTGDDEWSPRWGYGKLDTYEGLKMALRLADTRGIAAERAAREPLTLLRREGEWRLLLGSNEARVDITVSDEGGRAVLRHVLTDVRRGDEHVLQLSRLRRGTYVVSIATAGARLVRKLCR